MSYVEEDISMSDSHPDAPITLTHARLRAAQGDVPAALRILQEVLIAEPANAEARKLFRVLGGEGGSSAGRQPPLTGAAALEAWRNAIRRNRGQRRDVG